ncbi:hypothetical protein ACFV3R_07275 [Streptomyces sp. NPDC059740]|uniref:hypothetical protein n=1 Tax=Streptomyces sp. NPDC059740 TaxID=3346926 RepID=UPI00365E6F18
MSASSAHQPAAAAPRADQVPVVTPGTTEPRPTMDALLASCAAADAVSTPPPAPAQDEADRSAPRVVAEDAARHREDRHRDAA